MCTCMPAAGMSGLHTAFISEKLTRGDELHITETLGGWRGGGNMKTCGCI